MDAGFPVVPIYKSGADMGCDPKTIRRALDRLGIHRFVEIDPPAKPQQLTEQDSLRRITANLSVFEKAIAGSHDYDGPIPRWRRQGR